MASVADSMVVTTIPGADVDRASPLYRDVLGLRAGAIPG